MHNRLGYIVRRAGLVALALVQREAYAMGVVAQQLGKDFSLAFLAVEHQALDRFIPCWAGEGRELTPAGRKLLLSKAAATPPLPADQEGVLGYLMQQAESGGYAFQIDEELLWAIAFFQPLGLLERGLSKYHGRTRLEQLSDSSGNTLLHRVSLSDLDPKKKYAFLLKEGRLANEVSKRNAYGLSAEDILTYKNTPTLSTLARRCLKSRPQPGCLALGTLLFSLLLIALGAQHLQGSS